MGFGNEIWSYLLTVGSYWHKVNASELHFARSFQGQPIWPYLACPLSKYAPQIPYLSYLAVFGHVFEKLLSPLHLLMVCAFSGGGELGMSGAEPVVSRHCPPCLSWRGDPSAHKWGRSPSRPPPLFCSLMDFYDPNDFDDPQASNDPKGISISSLIIQKPAVVPPSSMVLFLLMSTQV